MSALLFRGELSRCHALWKRKAFIIVASGEIVEEYVRFLAYPRFRLTEKEIRDLVHEELLPYVEPVMVNADAKGASEDPDDDKFLACAEAAKADFIVSGDSHLLSLKRYRGCPILTAEKFLKRFR
jgi:putative PIN family toxin of toxin-antitoxin system